MATSSSIGSSAASVVSTGSTTYIASTASGLDTTAIIDAAVAQKTAPADAIDAKITANKSKISAYQNLQNLVNAVATSLTPLAGTTYSAAGNTNDFDKKSTTVTASDGSTGTDYIAVDADPTALSASYDVTVTQLAKAMKIASSTLDSSSALGLSGTLTIGVTGSGTANVALTSNMTLSDVASAISSVSGTTGVNATVIKVTDGSTKLVLSTAETDQTISFSADDSGILTSLGLTDGDGNFANVLQQPQDAEATIDGTPITRSTNEWDDVIPGLSLSLLQTTASGTSLTLTASPDLSSVKTDVTNFVTAYNNLRSFVATQQTVNSDGSISSDAALFADSLLSTLNQMFAGLMNQQSVSSTGDVNYLSDLGLTYQDDNTLTSNSTTLDNALLSNLDAVSSFFQTSFSASDSALKLLQNTSTASQSFTMHVDTDGSGNIADVLANGQTGCFTVSGNRIVGIDNTPYQGLSFALVTSNSEDIDVSLNQGFANLGVNLLNSYGDASNGLIEQQIDRLTSTDADLSSQSTDFRNDAETYRQTLVDKYANMETEVSSAQLVQKQIEALLGSLNSDSGS